METVETTGTATVHLTKTQRAFKTAAWTGFAILCLVVFTLIKLPDARLKAQLQNLWRPLLASQGITVDAEETNLSIGFGLAYELKKATVQLRDSQAVLRFDRIIASPSLLRAVLGRAAGVVVLKQKKGTLKVGGSVPVSGKKPEGHVDLDASDFDLGEANLFSMLSMNGTALVGGKGALDGDLSLPSSWSGNITLELKQIRLPEQVVYGFALPAVSVADGKIDVKIDNGKLTIKTLTLGKKGSADDLWLDLTGDLQLGRQLDQSVASVKARFSFSEKVRKAVSILESFIAPARQADGSYAYQINGPLRDAYPTPMEAPR